MRNMDTHIYNLGIRVLIYEEEGQMCAHALELDLVGYGKTEKKAISALHDMIQAQITFARFKNDDKLWPFPAPKDVYERWETAHNAALRKEILRDKTVKVTIKAVCINISDELAKPSRTQFKVMELSCA
jgi:hypothetical protein